VLTAGVSRSLGRFDRAVADSENLSAPQEWHPFQKFAMTHELFVFILLTQVQIG
jgi:hypothetical protein